MSSALNDELRKAIESLPATENAAYLEAVSKCPDLIQSESNPEWFLRVDGGKVPVAAQRMALYWQRRVEAFGDQAFLPLATALSEDDKEMLEREAFVRLPECKGKPALLLDLDRVGSHDGFESSRIRLIFYWAWKLGMCTSAQTEGVIMLRRLKRINFGTSNIRRKFTLIEEAMPFRVHEFIMCCIMPPRDRKYFLREGYPSAIRAFNEVLPGRVHIHVTKNESEMLGRLVNFEPSGLPPSLGGVWRSPEESSVAPPRAASVGLDQQARKRLKQAPEPAKSPPSAVVPAVTEKLHSVVKSGITLKRDPRPVGPAAVLQALDALRRAKNCSVNDLMARPSFRSHVVALLDGRSGSVLPPMSTASNSSTHSPGRHIVASQATLKPALSAEQDEQKQQLKKRVLEGMVARLKKREAHGRGPIRSTLISQLVQKLATRPRGR